jgi:hypothetical protein
MGQVGLKDSTFGQQNTGSASKGCNIHKSVCQYPDTLLRSPVLLYRNVSGLCAAIARKA